MEKPPGTNLNEWQYNDQSPPTDVLLESICCPCIVYGRTNLRLKVASDERDGQNIVERAAHWYMKAPLYPLMSSNCCVFATCCPSTTPNTECDEPLPSIPEEGSTTIPSSMSSRRTSASRRRERSIARDPVAPTDATLVNAHELSQDPTTPAMYKGNVAPHRLSKDPVTLAHPPPTHHLRDDTKAQISSPRTDTGHDHFHDARDTRPSRPRGHGTEGDHVDSFRPRRASDTTGHDIHNDPTAPSISPVPASHHLHDDENTSARSPPLNAHHLQHDMANSRVRSPRPHTLEADESVPSKSASPGPHHLQHDK
ncbi:hypothetical protein ACHAPT_009851 [Fusarium lateritium]